MTDIVSRNAATSNVAKVTIKVNGFSIKIKHSLNSSAL